MRHPRLIAAAAAATIAVGGFAGLAHAGTSPDASYTVPAAGGTVTVHYSGFTANNTVFINICNSNGAGTFDPATNCTDANSVNPSTDAAGAGQTPLDIFSGANDLDSIVCNSTHACWVRIANGTKETISGQAFVPIIYSGVVVTTTSTTTTTVAPTTSTTIAPGTTTTTTVAPGTTTTTTTVVVPPLVPEVPLNVLLPVSAIALIGGAIALSRRRAAKV